jgi:hypothetical protein
VTALDLANSSKRFQVFDQVLLLFVAQPQAQCALVVVDNLVQGLEPAVMIVIAP